LTKTHTTYELVIVPTPIFQKGIANSKTAPTELEIGVEKGGRKCSDVPERTW